MNNQYWISNYLGSFDWAVFTLFAKIAINSSFSWRTGHIISSFKSLFRRNIFIQTFVSLSSFKRIWILWIKSRWDSPDCASPYNKAGAVQLLIHWLPKWFASFVFGRISIRSLAIIANSIKRSSRSYFLVSIFYCTCLKFIWILNIDHSVLDIFLFEF